MDFHSDTPLQMWSATPITDNPRGHTPCLVGIPSLAIRHHKCPPWHPGSQCHVPLAFHRAPVGPSLLWRPCSPQPSMCLKVAPPPAVPTHPGDSCGESPLGPPLDTLIVHPAIQEVRAHGLGNHPANTGKGHSSSRFHPSLTISTKPGISSPIAAVTWW